MAAPQPAGHLMAAGGIIGAPLAAGAPTSTFAEFYSAASVDEYNRIYGPVMAVFESAPGGPTPLQIRELIVNTPRESSLGFAVLIIPTHAPASPGMIYAIHLLSKFQPRLGQPASQWDNRMFGSIGEVVANQIPVTVELPVTAFTRQQGGNLFRVGHPQRMPAMFGADPDLELLGEFNNFDAGTELIQSRNMVPIPHRYMRHFIAGPLTPRQAWEIVGNEVNTHGDQATCAPLLNFLRLACTRNMAGDTASVFARPELTVPLSDTSLIQHRTELIAHKLPGLNSTPTLAAGQQVAQSLGLLVAEQRAARQDLVDRHAASAIKTIEEYFGASTHTLLCVCQVANSSLLPPVYQTMADYGKKKERITMQRAVDDMMSQMGLSQLHFVVTADLANKLSSLMWKSHPEDLSQGIHPFCVGETSPDAIAALQELARKYDLISSDGAAPSLLDARELVGGGKASIPRNLISLDAQNQLFLVLLRVFLGTTHLVTQAWEGHTVATQQQLLNLQFYTPRTPRHQLLLPALIQRWCQLRFSYWLERQWNSMNDIAPPDWSELWMHITLKTDWESPLPERHLAPLASTLRNPPGSVGSGTSTQMSALTGTTTSSTASAAASPADAAAAPATPTASNFDSGVIAKNVPYLEVYAPFRATGKRIRPVIKAAIEAGNHLPKNARGTPMCVSYHVKGVCNSNCGRNSDHAPHSNDDTARLVAWCGLAFGA
jgi:hypothetical protein